MEFGKKLRQAVEKLRTGKLDKETVKEVVKEIQRALIASDVEISLVLGLSKKIEEEAFKELPEGINRREHIIKATYDLLAGLLGKDKEVPKNPERILLIGLFGSGKTSSAAKLAKYYSKRGKKVGLIAADTYRPGAYDQLKQLAEQVKVDFYGNPKEKHSATIVKQGMKELDKSDLVIVDSAGRSSLDEELVKELKEITRVLNPDYTFLVLSADIGQVARKQVTGFHDASNINGVIVTKLDGSAKGGGALAACAITDSPVYFIGIGEKIEDLEEFEPERYLSRIMGYGDLKSLLEKAREIEMKEVSIEDVMKGKFNLQMFYDQLKAARQMGPLKKVMEMIGMGNQVPEEFMQVGEEKLDNFKVVMDSMTKQEKENPDLITSSRIERVAKGSGKKQADVRELMKHYKQMKKMFKQFQNPKLQKQLESGKMDFASMMGKSQQKKYAKKKFKIR